MIGERIYSGHSRTRRRSATRGPRWSTTGCSSPAPPASIRTPSSIPPDVDSQCENCFRNIERALKEAGASLADLVRVQIFLANESDFERVAPIIRKHCYAARPANTTVFATHGDAADAGRDRGDGEDRAVASRCRAQSQNANVRVSMLSRGGAFGGVLGSSNAECAVKRVGTFGSVSNTLNTSASLRSICGK